MSRANPLLRRSNEWWPGAVNLGRNDGRRMVEQGNLKAHRLVNRFKDVIYVRQRRRKDKLCDWFAMNMEIYIEK